jgi:uncharacterized membrane protein YcaP (DUF421 family)
MELLKIVILSLTSIIILFILTKIIGSREMSQLSMFDYINSITIGSIAAEMATSLEENFMQPLIAMITYAIVIIILEFIASKSLKLRRFINGTSLILLDNGKLYKENFKRAKLDISEFLTECRNKNYFNISDIQTAILEPNGKLSILPKSLKRPATPEDLNILPSQEQIVTNVISDGEILINNLKSTGNNETWLNNKLKEQNVPNVKDIFLATCDSNNNLSIYTNIDKQIKHDAFV